jgi:multimeric flavodoxin WrbA
MPANNQLSAVVLLATLKKSGLSNTETLVDFLTEKFAESDVSVEKIKLVDHNLVAGTYFDMDGADDWPAILAKLQAADIVIFATPIWWNNQSSEMQRVIERLDEVHDEITDGKTSRLEGKPFGIIVTGDSDGAQHIIANLANFANAVGMTFPPYSTLTVLSEKQAKGKNTSREELLEYYEKEYASTADKMIEQLKNATGAEARA